MNTKHIFRCTLMLFFACSLSASFVSCSDDQDDDGAKPSQGNKPSINTGESSVTGSVQALYITGAKVDGYVNVSDEVLSNAQFGVLCSTKSGVNIDNYVSKQTSVSLEGKQFVVTFSGLAASTEYYYRSYTRIGSNYVYGVEKNFTTKGVTSTANLSEQEGRTATFTCTTSLEDFDLQSERNTYGLIWGRSADLDIDNCDGRKLANSLESGKYTVKISSLNYSTTYYYCAYTCTCGKYTYSKVQEFTTSEKPTVRYEYVDLGLSVKWATMNVGAESPEDYGDYFAWGETEPKSTYDWGTYKWCNGSSNTMTKYCTSLIYGKVDPKTTLDPEDDAAHVNWGGDWRMPTMDELNELRNNCTWTWTSQNGVNGYKVVGPNGNSLFLPAAGGRSDGYLGIAGSYGFYWSSSLSEYRSYYAQSLDFNVGDVGWYGDYRYCGFSVRPVCQ